MLSKASVPFVRHILVGTAFCALCFPVSLALIKYLCFHAELLTLLPQLVSSCPVSDDICTSVTQHHLCLFCVSGVWLCYLTFPLPVLLCHPFC